MYNILHVLHVSLYIPLMLYSWFLLGVFGFVQCCIVFVLLNAIFMLLCLKRLVSFLIYGLWYVKVAHFLFSSLSFFWWIFCCICVFRFVMSFSGKMFHAMACIVFHSDCCLSVVSGSDCILVMWYQKAAILCSVGWLDRKLIVVSVVVGFRHISISRLIGFRIIKRLRKFIQLLFSCVGLSWRFRRIWFMYSWMVLEFMHFVSYISTISSTYLV